MWNNKYVKRGSHVTLIGTRCSMRACVYHVEKVPCDTRMRTILDGVTTEELWPAYKEVFRELQKGKAL